jgi:hypothetical protein
MRNSRQLLSALRRPSFVVGDFELEIAQEKASSLGRLGRRLEAALAALQAFDASRVPTADGQREALLAEAGTLLWHFIVQREACGLRDSTRVMQDYGVPQDVRVRMGVSRRKTEG